MNNNWSDNWDVLLGRIESGLVEKGISPAAASRMAVGHPYLIYKFRKGSKPKYETLKKLCDVLDLEFYIGPPRGGTVEFEPWSKTMIHHRLHDKLEEVLQAGGDEAVALRVSIERIHDGLARFRKKKKGTSSRSGTAEEAS